MGCEKLAEKRNFLGSNTISCIEKSNGMEMKNYKVLTTLFIICGSFIIQNFISISVLHAQIQETDNESFKSLPEEQSLVNDGTETEDKKAQENIIKLIRVGRWNELVKMGDAAIDVLIDHLQDADWKKRVMIAETLGKMGNAKAVAPLIGLLRDDYVEVRKNSLIALGMIGDPKAIEPIQHLATTDGNPDIKDIAKDVLGKLSREKENNPPPSIEKDKESKEIVTTLKEMESKPASSGEAPQKSDNDEIKRILQCINDSLRQRDVDRFCQFLSKEDSNFFIKESKKIEEFFREIQILNSSFDGLNISVDGNIARVQYVWNLDFKWRLYTEENFKSNCKVCLKLKKISTRWEIIAAGKFDS